MSCRPANWTFVCLVAVLASARPPVLCAAPEPAPSSGVVTNFVVVTNVVVVTVTNYVVTTNVVLSTNSVAAGRSDSALPDLSWVPPEDRFDWI